MISSLSLRFLSALRIAVTWYPVVSPYIFHFLFSDTAMHSFSAICHTLLHLFPLRFFFPLLPLLLNWSFSLQRHWKPTFLFYLQWNHCYTPGRMFRSWLQPSCFIWFYLFIITAKEIPFWVLVLSWVPFRRFNFVGSLTSDNLKSFIAPNNSGIEQPLKFHLLN